MDKTSILECIERRPKAPTFTSREIRDERLHARSASIERTNNLKQTRRAEPQSLWWRPPINEAFRPRLWRANAENSLCSSLTLQVASCFFRSALLIRMSRLSHQIWQEAKPKLPNLQQKKIVASPEQPEKAMLCYVNLNLLLNVRNSRDLRWLSRNKSKAKCKYSVSVIVASIS